MFLPGCGWEAPARCWAHLAASMEMDLRRQLLRLLLGLLPCHPTKNERTDCDRALTVSGGPLIDDGEKFNRETNAGCC